MQKRETKAINKLCAPEILSLSFVCGAYFFEFRGRNLVCFVIAYNFNGKYAGKQGRHACALRFSRVSVRRLYTDRCYLCRIGHFITHTKKCMENRTNPDKCPDLSGFSYISL